LAFRQPSLKARSAWPRDWMYNARVFERQVAVHGQDSFAFLGESYIVELHAFWPSTELFSLAFYNSFMRNAGAHSVHSNPINSSSFPPDGRPNRNGFLAAAISSVTCFDHLIRYRVRSSNEFEAFKHTRALAKFFQVR